MISYELMDCASGNLIGSFAFEHQAFAMVRNIFDAWGFPGLSDLSLIRVSGEQQELIANGMDLAHKAMGNVLIDIRQ